MNDQRRNVNLGFPQDRLSRKDSQRHCARDQGLGDFPVLGANMEKERPFAYVNVAVNLDGNPKFKRLIRKLKQPKIVVKGLLLGLWQFAADYEPNGVLETEDDFDDAINFTEYEGDVEEVKKLLIECKFIDEIDCGYYLHNWHLRQPILNKRKTDRGSAQDKKRERTGMNRNEPERTGANRSESRNDRTGQDRREEKRQTRQKDSAREQNPKSEPDPASKDFGLTAFHTLLNLKPEEHEATWVETGSGNIIIRISISDLLKLERTLKADYPDVTPDKICCSIDVIVDKIFNGNLSAPRNPNNPYPYLRKLIEHELEFMNGNGDGF